MSQLLSPTFMEQATEEMSHEDFGTLGSNREEQETQVTPGDGDGDSSRHESSDETTTADEGRHVVHRRKRRREINDKTPSPERGGRRRREREEKVTLKVVSQAHCEMNMLVKMRRTSKFHHLMNSFCQQFKLDEGKTRFLYDGKRINATLTTPKDLEMEDNDIIEVHMEQFGGQLKC